MPILKINRNSILEERINIVSKRFTIKNLNDFIYTLTDKESNYVPEKSEIRFIDVCLFVRDVLENRVVEVNTFRSRYPWSKMVARTSGRNISFNSRKNHTVESITETISHELVHIADSYDIVNNYGHGSNRNQGSKKNTAPIMFGELFSKYLLSIF